MRYTFDIETALYERLTADGYSASAHKLPADLDGSLHVHVTRTGGTTSSMVIESNNIDFDVYAEDDADAMIGAANLCAWVRELSGEDIGSMCYAAEINTLPYPNPDPRHPNIGRATFKAQLLTRTKESKNA